MGLKILVVGAGPAGLAAALALARANKDHDIHIYEKSHFSREVGAALHLQPQIVRILRDWDIDPVKDMRGIRCRIWRQLSDLSIGGTPEYTKFDADELAPELGVTEPELMIHRVDAHDCLREHALAHSNVSLHLASGIASVDPAGTITLEDGSTVTGDLIIGADGIHSRCLRPFAKSEDDLLVTPAPMNIYRFLVPTSDALADPDMRPFLEAFDWKHTLSIFVNKSSVPPRELVVYPCRDGEILNCATFIPTAKDTTTAPASWSEPGDQSVLKEVLEGYPTYLSRLADHADKDEITHWTLAGRDVPTTYVKDRLVLIGDAAHPMPPTHAAGAGTGIEEAAALGVMLGNVAPDGVTQALEAYNDLRYPRGTIFKYSSDFMPHMRANLDAKKMIQGKLQARLGDDARLFEDAEMLQAMWTHEAVQEAKSALAKSR